MDLAAGLINFCRETIAVAQIGKTKQNPGPGKNQFDRGGIT
jgi:hypothetical protein